MKNFCKLSIFLLSFGLTSCGSSEPKNPPASATTPVQTKEVFFNGTPDPIVGKIDVYNSMARTVKYNVDNAADLMREKVLPKDTAQKPKEVLRNLTNVQNEGENPLYVNMRALEFAITYAASNLSTDPGYIKDNIYMKSSQNLAKAAIKSHKDTLFSLKKNKEIDRILSRESKALRDIIAKEEKNGRLNDDDLALKKGLEVAIYKLTELRKAFTINVINYGHLVKAPDLDKLSLEGRKFYELEDFDRSLTINIFQKSAFKNRDEFLLGHIVGRDYTYKDIELITFRKYPDLERLQINGFNPGSPVYIKSLEKRSIDTATNLIDKVIRYQAIPNDNDDKPALRAEAFEELAVAIFAQIELSYNLVHAADEDLKDIESKVSSLKKEVAVLNDKYRLAPTQRIELLDAQIKLTEYEAQMSQILGERAMAIRSLYFSAGFSPFNRKFLHFNLKEMVQALKVGFNKDAVEMLAAVPAPADAEKEGINNEWAKQDNWLETLLEKKRPVKEEKPFGDPKGMFDPYLGDIYNQKKVMQLGSYQNRSSADLEWTMLQQLYEELNEYTPRVEKTKINDKIFYRLMVLSPEGGLQQMCNKLRADKVECILR